MRHDAKLGLALGMLATGFAVAFCCPRQPASTAWLQTGARHPLDRSVLHLFPIKAYQPSPAAPASPSEKSEVPPAGPSVVDPLLPAPLAPPPLSPVLSIDPILIPTTQESGRTGFAPPVGQALSHVLTEIPRVPPAPADRLVPTPAMEEREPAPAQRYTVQAGDTLSGIASRFLGSSARFLEIYQMNQEVLSSPDNLQVGMVLTLPSPPESSVANSVNRDRTRSTNHGSGRIQPYQQAVDQPPVRR